MQRATAAAPATAAPSTVSDHSPPPAAHWQAAVTISGGDKVVFHAGFACQWQVLKPMRKHYQMVDADGNPVRCRTCPACS